MLHEGMFINRNQPSKEVGNEFSGRINIIFEGLKRKGMANYRNKKKFTISSGQNPEGLKCGEACVRGQIH